MKTNFIPYANGGWRLGCRVYGLFSIFALIMTATVSVAFGQDLPHYGDGATYSVPVPDELKDAATFPLPQAIIQQDGTHVRLDYRLPPELVGPNSPFISLDGQVSGSNGPNGPTVPFDVTGSHAQGHCVPQPTTMTCTLKMDATVVNLPAAKAFIDSTVLDPTRHDKLMQVLLRFGGDAIGVIQYNK